MGRPGKLKSGTKNKLKTWSKGNSSSSNPASFKHRENARSKFFHMQPTSKSNKGLTSEALKLHDELEKGFVQHMHISDEGSESAETFGTFLSGVSDCTNLTFRKIQRYWLNHSAKHKEVCAVLGAITEVIRQQDGEESDTAYFAALITALSSVEQVESAAAVGYLLSMTVKNVPSSVLRAKFGEVSKLLTDILNQCASKQDGVAPTAYIRSILSILAVVLRSQEKHVWKIPSTMHTFHALLAYVSYPKPKIRKSAQNAVCSVLFGSEFMNGQKSLSLHPAAVATAKFCITQLKNFGGVSADSSVCHVLQLLSRVLHCFPQSCLQRVCETILSLMTLSDLVVKSVCFQTLHGMFINQPQHKALPPDLNAKIITALYDYYPNSSDAQTCPAWLAVMEKALLNLSVNYIGSSLEGEAAHLALVHIPKLTTSAFRLMLSQSSVVAKAANSTLLVVLKDGAAKFWNRKESGITKEDECKFISSVFKMLEEGLKYKYRDVWDLVFHIAEAMFQSIVKPSHISIAKPFLESIVDLRITPHFQFRTELDHAVGAAIGTFGAKMFLAATPLLIDGTETDYDFPRSWFLPLIKKYSKRTELAFFSEYFLPLASKVRAKAAELKQSNRNLEASTYETIYLQCWDLLPIFFKEAVDISASFPKLARILGRALNDHTELQSTIMAALRNIITASKTSEKDQAVVAQFSKNFLPILFNIYTTVKVGSSIQLDESESGAVANKTKSIERLASLETIRLYLTITSKELLCSYFPKAQYKVFNGDETDPTRLALFDLLVLMVPYVTEHLIVEIYNEMKPMLCSPISSFQKKAYRVLEEVCSSLTPPCCSFVRQHLSELQEVLLNGLFSASPSSKGPRIKCLEKVYIQLLANAETRDQSEEFLKVVIPEVILCTKEAKRSRIAAFNLIVTTAKEYVSSQPEVNEHDKNFSPNALDKYFEIVFTGLSGTPVMIKATIFTLSRLVYEFKDVLSSSLLDQTITNVCLLLGCNTHEVTQASLGFVVVLMHILSRQVLAQYLKGILDALLDWNNSTRQRFRFKVKKILQKLVQKFGFETIYSMTPEIHRKQLEHTKKQQARHKRIAALHKQNEDDEEADVDLKFKSQKKETIEEILALSSDSEDEAEGSEKKNKKTLKMGAWLQEEEEEPMDLLDPSMSQKILSKNPKAPVQTAKSEFEIGSDGRLIITEDTCSDKSEVNKVFKSIGLGTETNSSGALSSANKKRSFEDSDDDSIPATKSYKPGGKGIHRDLVGVQRGERFETSTKKARGDKKLKGAYQPYSYLPFNASSLNKRKRKKLSGQYEGIVRAAKKGAAIGKKRKSKKSRQGKN